MKNRIFKMATMVALFGAIVTTGCSSAEKATGTDTTATDSTEMAPNTMPSEVDTIKLSDTTQKAVDTLVTQPANPVTAPQ